MARRLAIITAQCHRLVTHAAMVALAVVLGLTALVASVRAAELVMFEEAGCPWCARWEQDVGEAYANSEEGRIAPLRRIDISEARRSGVRLAAAVTVTPTFVLVEDGAEVGRITGYPGADFFWGMLGELMARLPSSTSGRPGERRIAPGRQASRSAPSCDSGEPSGLMRGRSAARVA